MGDIGWIVIALLGGSMIPLQGALNSRLGSVISSILHASMISLAVGTVATAAFVLATRQTASWASAGNAPWYAWFGGLCGAFCLTAINFSFPKLGPGLTFGLIIAGQLIFSVLLEHFNVLVAEPHPLSLLRLTGVVLVLSGVVLIRAF